MLNDITIIGIVAILAVVLMGGISFLAKPILSLLHDQKQTQRETHTNSTQHKTNEEDDKEVRKKITTLEIRAKR